jgi:hypothetical protein
MYRREQGHDALRDAHHRVHALVLVTVERALPLISPAYDDGTTEEEGAARIREQSSEPFASLVDDLTHGALAAWQNELRALSFPLGPSYL